MSNLSWTCRIVKGRGLQGNRETEGALGLQVGARGSCPASWRLIFARGAKVLITPLARSAVSQEGWQIGLHEKSMAVKPVSEDNMAALLAL